MSADILAYVWTTIGFTILVVSVISPMIAWEEYKINKSEREALTLDEPTDSEILLSDAAITLSRRLFIKTLIYIPMNAAITAAGVIAIRIPPTTQQGETRAEAISSILISMEFIMAAGQISLFVILYGTRQYRQRWYGLLSQRRDAKDR